MERSILLSIPEEEFFERLADALARKLMLLDFPLPTAKVSQKWLTHAEAANYIRKTKASLYKLTSERQIKYSKRGKQNFYLIEYLDEYLSAGEVSTKNEVRSSILFTPKYSAPKNK